MSQIINIAEIWAHNIPNTRKAYLQVEKDGVGGYYYLTSKGDRSEHYNSLLEAKANIKDLWGNWIDFKLLV